MEAILGEALDMPGSIGHNWSQTYTILQEDPKVLFYTGSEIDTYIAGKLGEKKLTSEEMIETHMEDYTEKGYVTSFSVAMEYYGSRDKIKPVHYQSFVLIAVQNDSVNILDVPAMRAYMSKMSPDDIEEVLQQILEDCPSPRTIDFFLSTVNHDQLVGVTTLDKYVYDLIYQGAFALIRVFLKHGLVHLPMNEKEEVDAEYADLDMDYGGYKWNPVYLAAKCGHADILRLLLQQEAVKKIEMFWFNIHTAVTAGYTEVIRIMLEDGRILYREPYLPVAVHLGWTEIVKLLVEAYSRDDNGLQHEWFQLVSSAVNNDRAEIVRLLLSTPNLAPLSHRERGELIATAKYNGNAEIERMLRLYE